MQALFRSLFPENCAFCGGRLSGELRRICPDCAGHLEAPGEGCCELCREDMGGNPPETHEGIPRGPVCGPCSAGNRGFDKAEALFHYDRGPASFLVLRFKYHRDRSAGEDIAGLTAPGIRRFAHERPGWLALSVPSSRRAVRERGFRQVDFILERAGIRAPGLIRRKEAPVHQVSLGAADRQNRIRGQYGLVSGAEATIEGRDVMLFDDVLTTGSTLGEVSRLLKGAGARRVEALAFFRESFFFRDF